MLFVLVQFVIRYYFTPQKSKEGDKRSEKQKQFSYFSLFFMDKFVFIISLIAIQFALAMLAAGAGRDAAYRQKGYHTLQYENRNFIVIREHKERILAVPFDRQHKTFTRQFFLINSNELAEKRIPITFAEVGPLKPK